MNNLHLGTLLLGALLFAVPAAAPLSAAEEAEHPVFINADEMKWDSAPPGLPAGAKATVVYGDPHKPGPFVVRLMTPAGYKIMPHWHTRAENLTVISGALYLGGGDSFDYSKAHALKPGGYHYLPARMHHFAFTDMPTVVQIHGEGPFDINYVRQSDDPRGQVR
ncbi:cupin domain-containing protein [Geomonas sp. RF6]|uniref:cupin domain-containing protein n=1 Tax=Geomonas sp. RF6 TaxID=2897342 RepID=UPI001E33249D|nr:cupin domain-containing protein [Geomonas sp. RF6]UFS71663.1 cupin domain-containing protein [Geomonas sp. RF6]